MDIDFRILQELSKSPLASNAELGRAVDLSRPAVHARLKKLEANGALEGFIATPAPALFGRTAVSGIWLDGEIEVSNVIELEDVIWSGHTVDGYTGFMAYTKDREMFLERVSEAFPNYQLAQDMQIPTAEITLGPLEWKVLRAMLSHPRGPMADLVEATGLTRKTVAGRRKRLMEMEAVRVLPVLRPPRHGPIYHHMLIYLKNRDPIEDIIRLLGDVFVEADYGESLYLFCRAEDVREQRQRFHEVENHEGVERALLVLNSVFEQNNARLLDWIDTELAHWDLYRSKSSAKSGS